MHRLNEQLSKSEWKAELGRNMRDMGEQIARAAMQEALYHGSHALDRAEERYQEKLNRQERRRMEKEARRQARREARLSRIAPVEGYLSITAALILVGVIVMMPHQLWWLVFIALHLTFRGTRILSYHASARRLPSLKQGSPPKATDERAGRIDDVCNKLLAALKDAPQSVRDFLSTPEQTVETLRKSCHDLLKKEIALRALANPEESARLDRERAGLEARIAGETDDVVRSRLQGALTALDHQRSQLAEVVRSANRLEAERTRLGYTLDGLYAQVMRVRTADAGSEDVVSAGLRQSLDQLRDEMGALADAVEQVNRVPVPPAPSGMESPEAPAPRGRIRS